MGYPLNQILAKAASVRERNALSQALSPVYDQMSSQTLTSAGIVIFGAGATTAKTGAAATIALIKGRLMSVAGSTTLSALVGTVSNARFNVFAFFLTAAGTVVTLMGVEATTLQGVIFPAIPPQTATLGFAIVNPTGTGPFIGGATTLDSATVIPNAQFISTIGAFDPTTTI